MQHLASTDSTVSIGVLPPKGAEGSSKASMSPKKNKQVKKPSVEKEVTKEAILSKSGVLKRAKKRAKKPTDSPVKQPMQEPEIESTKQKHVDTSNTLSSQKCIKKI